MYTELLQILLNSSRSQQLNHRYTWKSLDILVISGGARIREFDFENVDFYSQPILLFN